MKKVTLNSIKNISTDELRKMNATEMKEYLDGARELFEERVETFKKTPKGFYSGALEKMEDYYSEFGKSNTKSRDGNMAEIFRLQEFFNAKTSTVRGTYKTMRDQDAAIFGVDADGNPLKRMSWAERTAFWRFYNEYLKTYKSTETQYTSFGFREYLGEYLTKGRNGEKGNIDFTEISKMHDFLEKIDEEGYTPNVYSGRGLNK